MFPQQIIIVAGYWKSIRGTIAKLGCKFKKIDFKHCKAAFGLNFFTNLPEL